MALASILKPAQLQAFRNLELMAHSVVEGFMTGQHRSPFKGFAIEFAEHRPYVAGDDPRHLDWKALAKQGRYYVKQYEEDTSLRAYLVLDASGSMAYRASPTAASKLDYARGVAAVLAYLLLRQRDAVGLVTCDEGIRTYLPPRSSLPHYKRLMDTLTVVGAAGRTGLADVLHTLAERIKRRALVLIISDCFDTPERLAPALSHFAHRRHEVAVLRVLDRRECEFDFTHPTQFEGLEDATLERVDPVQLRREYLRQFEAHRQSLRRACHERRMDFTEFITDQPIERALAHYLTRRLRTR